MRERIEKLIRDYPKNKMELECLGHQIRNFRGITEDEMIDSIDVMTTASRQAITILKNALVLFIFSFLLLELGFDKIFIYM